MKLHIIIQKNKKKRTKLFHVYPKWQIMCGTLCSNRLVIKVVIGFLYMKNLRALLRKDHS